MKRVFLVHGWGGNPENCWFPWLKSQLESKGFQVFVPKMPDTDEPRLDVWVPFLKEQVQFLDEDTYLVGHSIGCQTILRYLEAWQKKVGGIFLVAPWVNLTKETLEDDGAEEIARPWIDTPISWHRVKDNKIVCIFSDDDPYVSLSDSKIFRDNLDCEIITMSGKGHFDDDSGIKELPELLKEIISCKDTSQRG